MKQAEVMEALVCNTHAFMKPEFVAAVNTAFGTDLKCSVHKADRSPQNPKGLQFDDGATEAEGMDTRTIAELVCSKLGVKYEEKMGRGFQVVACVNALHLAGYPKDGSKYAHAH